MALIPSRRAGPELLDLPLESYTRRELEGSFDDIATVNRYLGDYRAVLKYMGHMASGSRGERLRVLDVGTGAADIPAVLSEWAAQAGLTLELTAVDNNPEAIDIARIRTGNRTEVEFVVADGLNLPFPSGSYDYVLCCKTLHHLVHDDAVRLVAEMIRVARRGYLILDLRRSWVAWFLISVLTRIFTRNRLTRHDGPLSVLRAFTPDEFAAVAGSAGALRFSIKEEPFWLMVGAGEVP